MKRLYTLLTLTLMAICTLTMTGCDDDGEIAYTLEGTWKGYMYMQNEYNGRVYQSSYSILEFSRDPYRYSSGDGRWVDYYSNAPWDYYASYITWRVVNSRIEIYSRSENYTYYIYDYRLNDGYFDGYISDGYNSRYFEMQKVYSPNWNDYNWNGYYYGNYWAPAKKDLKDSTSIVMPRRSVTPEQK